MAIVHLLRRVRSEQIERLLQGDLLRTTELLHRPPPGFWRVTSVLDGDPWIHVTARPASPSPARPAPRRRSHPSPGSSASCAPGPIAFAMSGMIGFGNQMYGDISNVAPRARARWMSLICTKLLWPTSWCSPLIAVRLARGFDGIESGAHGGIAGRVELHRSDRVDRSRPRLP